MGMQLKKAEKKKVKLKVGFSGPSGFGKTYSALLMAYGMCGDWTKIAVIDSENGSASLYSNLGEFNTINLDPPFTPERYIEAIKTCEDAGMEVIIADSITHEWDGEGGCLEIYEQLGGRYQDWSKVTPRHRKFVNKILQTDTHFITCVRKKQDYDMVKDGNKTKVVKVGMKEVTREGFEYELTLNLDLANDKHLCKASKDRTGLFMDRPEFIVTIETGKELMAWANAGVDEKQYLIESIQGANNREEGTTIWNNNARYQSDKDVIAAFKAFAVKFPKDAK
jgi:hypothetical protein